MKKIEELVAKIGYNTAKKTVIAHLHGTAIR